jgi:hypothetical protein
MHSLLAGVGEPERKCHRYSTAPAYYLGHPASFWITAMRPRRKPSTPPAPSGPPAVPANVRCYYDHNM